MGGNDTLNNLQFLNNLYSQSFYFIICLNSFFVIDAEKRLRGSVQ